jgi:hypothetical protein
MLPGYPEPRYPKLKKPKSVEELLPKARKLLEEPRGNDYHSLKPSYNLVKGDHILFVVLHEYDSLIIEAMCTAMREKGALVDLYLLDRPPLNEPALVAAEEINALSALEGDYNYYYTGVTDLIRENTARAMIDWERYDMVIAGSAGRLPWSPVPWHRFNYVCLEDFAGPAFDTPSELQVMINKKTWEQICRSKVLRLTDPEGTDIRWTNYDDGRGLCQNHLWARPTCVGNNFGGSDDAEGVVAGTLNHLGAFPHCVAEIKQGQVVKVTGGGMYGEVWEKEVKRYSQVELPELPTSPDGKPCYRMEDPGLFYFCECAIGTVPGMARTERESKFLNFANCLHDRYRSGYIHNGFGPAVVWKKTMIKARLPWVHVHIHNVFPTLRGETVTGDDEVIIDKGHLVSLDDPEIIKAAQKFGDPDCLLKESWFPAIPGINVAGDYMRDYGSDPVSWISREAREHPLWV